MTVLCFGQDFRPRQFRHGPWISYQHPHRASLVLALFTNFEAMASSKETKTFIVAVIGVGLVGSEFVDQLLSLGLPSVKLVYLSASEYSVFIPDGLDPSEDWRKALSSSRSTSDPEELIEMIKANFSPSKTKAIIVDNTSSEFIANFYPDFLKEGFHVITPNKKAFSSSQSLYDDIIATSKSGGARFLNESTVGAGLPVISTLKDLINTGDEVSIIGCCCKNG